MLTALSLSPFGCANSPTLNPHFAAGRHVFGCKRGVLHELPRRYLLFRERPELHILPPWVLLELRRPKLHEVPRWHLHDRFGGWADDPLYMLHVRAGLCRRRNEPRHGERGGLLSMPSGLILWREQRHLLAMPARHLQHRDQLVHVRLLSPGRLLRPGLDGEYGAVPSRLVLRELRHAPPDSAVPVGNLFEHGWRRQRRDVPCLLGRAVVPHGLKQHERAVPRRLAMPGRRRRQQPLPAGLLLRPLRLFMLPVPGRLTRERFRSHLLLNLPCRHLRGAGLDLAHVLSVPAEHLLA